MNVYYVTYWWKSGTSPVTFIYNSLDRALERFKDDGGTDYRVEGESLTGAYSAPEKGYEIQLGGQFVAERGAIQ